MPTASMPIENRLETIAFTAAPLRSSDRILKTAYGHFSKRLVASPCNTASLVLSPRASFILPCSSIQLAHFVQRHHVLSSMRVAPSASHPLVPGPDSGSFRGFGGFWPYPARIAKFSWVRSWHRISSCPCSRTSVRRSTISTPSSAARSSARSEGATRGRPAGTSASGLPIP